MTFITKIPTLPSSLCPCSFTNSSNSITPPPKSLKIFIFKPQNSTNFPIKKTSNPHKTPTSFCQTNNEISPETPHISSSSGVVSLRLKRLISEFRSLPQPIDRVKRLLDYAANLPQLGELTRLNENRVPGCAAQVWLEVEVDEMGRMRFRADSDSEITKGFCYCLIFLLNGAFPLDVLKVKAEDLADMNVGLPVRSRVNSWHNVLVNMQERTKSFLVDQDQDLCHLEPLDNILPSLAPNDTSITSKDEVCVQ